jgi:hypothetical protein
MFLFLKLAHELLGVANILGLGRLVATRKQDDVQVFLPDEVDPVSRPVIDTQLENAFAGRLYISRISKLETADTNVDAHLCRPIAKLIKPLCVAGRLTDFKHASTVSHGIQLGKVDILCGLRQAKCVMHGPHFLVSH